MLRPNRPEQSHHLLALVIVAITGHVNVTEFEQEIQPWQHLTGENKGAAHWYRAPGESRPPKDCRSADSVRRHHGARPLRHAGGNLALQLFGQLGEHQLVRSAQ